MSIFQADLEPQFEDLGFGWRSTNASLLSATGRGSSKPSTRGLAPDGLTLVEYDIGQSVTFQAVLDNGTDVEPAW